MPTHDRLALATKFVAALHDVSRRNPASWRRISAIGARTGIKGDQLDQVVADVVTAGLVEPASMNPASSSNEQGWAIVAPTSTKQKRRPAWGTGGATLLVRQSAVYGGDRSVQGTGGPGKSCPPQSA